MQQEDGSSPGRTVMRVLYVINGGGSTSVPHELAYHLGDDRCRVKVVSYYGNVDSQWETEDEEDLAAGSPLDARAISRLVALLRSYEPDLVHVHHTVSSLLTVLATKVVASAPVVRTFHNNRRHKSVIQKAADAISLPGLDALVCNSAATLRSLSRLEGALAPERRFVVHNGVDVALIEEAISSTSIADVRTEFGLPREGDLAVSVGSLTPQKNHETAIRSLETVAEEVHLAIMGDGPDGQRLRSLSEEIGVSDRVHFLGRVSRATVYQLHAAADLFLLCSRWEGFCNAAVEAVISGLPVVVSDIDTLREVLGSWALYVDIEGANASREVAARMTAVLGEAGSPRFEERLQRYSREAVRTYGMRKATDGYRSVYRELVNQSENREEDPRRAVGGRNG